MKTNNVITYEQINDALMRFFDDHEPLVESDKYFKDNYEFLISSRGIYSLT